jgi:hypothetical protein
MRGNPAKVLQEAASLYKVIPMRLRSRSNRSLRRRKKQERRTDRPRQSLPPKQPLTRRKLPKPTRRIKGSAKPTDHGVEARGGLPAIDVLGLVLAGYIEGAASKERECLET